MSTDPSGVSEVNIETPIGAILRAGVNIDETLLFAKAGVRLTRVELSRPDTTPGEGIEQQDDLYGAVLGIGLEKNISENVFTRFDVDYTIYGSQSFQNNNGSLTVGTYDFNSAEAGLKVGYRF